MKIAQISKILNRKYPMLLIDGVNEIVPNQMCSAYKNLTYNEWFFPEHFENAPVFPGSLQLEAFTQAVALPLLADLRFQANVEIPLLLAGVDKVRYYEPVIPGDRFDIDVRIDRIVLGIANASVKGSVNGKLVSECKITYKMNLGEQ